MAIKSISLGGFRIALTANASEAGLRFSVGGPLWRGFVRWIRRRRSSENSAQWDAAAGELAGSGAACVDRHAPEAAALMGRVNAIRWYHTIDLGNGIKTPGRFDHTPDLAAYRLPENVTGLRVLDVATFDGFWAFQFEKRGAREVYALDLAAPSDLDWPPKRLAQATPEELAATFGGGFALAKEQLGSNVRRVVCSVYDLRPESFGTFDIVHVGDLLAHLNSPIKALQNIARVCSGYALISDVYFRELDQLGMPKLVEYMNGADGPTWWRISLSALREMILDAGFARVELLNTFSHGYRVLPGRWRQAVFKACK